MTSLIILSLIFGLLVVGVAANELQVETFDGSPWVYNAWVSQIEAWFLFKDVTAESKKVEFWKMFVTPDVINWYLQQTAATTWNGVKALLSAFYLNDGVQATAFEKLMTIRQTGSVEAYNQYFYRLVQSVSSDRVNETLLRNRYISGLNRNLGKALLVHGGTGTWAQTMQVAVELAGSPPYTKAETTGHSGNPITSTTKAKKSSKKKVAMLTLSAMEAENDSLSTNALLPELDEVELLAYCDTASTYNLVSPSVVYWADLTVETAQNRPYDTLYDAQSQPVYLTQRVKYGTTTEYRGIRVTVEPMYFYVLRVPYVHHVYGKDMVKLLEKAYDKMTIGRGGENIVREEPNVVPTQMDPMSLVEQEEEPEPELEHSDNESGRNVGYPSTGLLDAQEPVVRPIRRIDMERDEEQMEGSANLVGLADDGRRLRVARVEMIGQRGTVPHYGRFGHRLPQREYIETISVLAVEARELNWYRPHKDLPPPIFQPSVQSYVQVRMRDRNR